MVHLRQVCGEDIIAQGWASIQTASLGPAVKTDGCITPAHSMKKRLIWPGPSHRPGASHCCSVTILNATARRKYRLLVNPRTVKIHWPPNHIIPNRMTLDTYFVAVMKG